MEKLPEYVLGHRLGCESTRYLAEKFPVSVLVRMILGRAWAGGGGEMGGWIPVTSVNTHSAWHRSPPLAWQQAEVTMWSLLPLKSRKNRGKNTSL